MHVLLITNDESGTADALDPEAAVREALPQARITRLDVAEAHAAAQREVVPAGDVTRVLVAGGDGSVGAAAKLAWLASVPLGVIPMGTANDFARAMGLPADPADAARLAAVSEHTRSIDLGDVGRPFVNVTSLGLAPHAAEHADSMKGLLSALAYPLGAMRALVGFRPIHVRAVADGDAVFDGRAWQVILACTGAFGGWGDTGGTRDGDGMLDLLVVPGGRRTRKLVLDARAVTQGDLADRDGVVHVRARAVELTLREPTQLVVDGELVDSDGTTVRAGVRRGPVRVVIDA